MWSHLATIELPRESLRHDQFMLIADARNIGCFPVKARAAIRSDPYYVGVFRYYGATATSRMADINAMAADTRPAVNLSVCTLSLSI